jgi:ribosomal-protein-alanine N-acetyltransferase
MMKITKAKLFKKTRRLDIRPLELKDYSAWKSALSEQREVQNQWDETNWDEKFLTPAEFKKTLARHKQQRDLDKNYFMAIFRRDDGAMIGFMSLMDISRAIFQNAYLGYRIFNTHWLYGYGKEAAVGLMELGFKNLLLHRIEAGIDPKNKASIALAKSIGLRKEGLSPKRLCPDGKWIDILVYAATSEDLKIKYRFPKPGPRIW